MGSQTSPAGASRDIIWRHQGPVPRHSRAAGLVGGAVLVCRGVHTHWDMYLSMCVEVWVP